MTMSHLSMMTGWTEVQGPPLQSLENQTGKVLSTTFFPTPFDSYWVACIIVDTLDNARP